MTVFEICDIWAKLSYLNYAKYQNGVLPPDGALKRVPSVRLTAFFDASWDLLRYSITWLRWVS